MAWQKPKFRRDGLVNVDHMLGPFEKYDRGSQKWAEAIAAHLQHSVDIALRNGDPVSVLIVLKEAVRKDQQPWEVWPEEANGDPEAWIRMVTGKSWAEVANIITTRKGPAAWGPIAQMLQAHGVDGISSPEAIATTLRQLLATDQLAEVAKLITDNRQPAQAARDRQRKRRGTDLSPRACACCGSTFTPKRTDARFCSGACRAKASRQAST